MTLGDGSKPTDWCRHKKLGALESGADVVAKRGGNWVREDLLALTMAGRQRRNDLILTEKR